MSSVLTPLKSSSLVLTLHVSICNWFHAKRANRGKITTFKRGGEYLSVSPACVGLLEHLNIVGDNLDCWNLRFGLMLKISYACCLSPAISKQFTLKMCVAGRNHEKFTKTLLLEVQDNLRSSMLINVKSPSPVLVMMCSMSLPICNCFHTRQANGDK